MVIEWITAILMRVDWQAHQARLDRTLTRVEEERRRQDANGVRALPADDSSKGSRQPPCGTPTPRAPPAPGVGVAPFAHRGGLQALGVLAWIFHPDGDSPLYARRRGGV